MRPDHKGELVISVSQLKAYLLCPRQYELKYVRGVEPEFLPMPLAFGAALHTSLAYFYGIAKLENRLASHKELVETFKEAWLQKITGPVPLQEQDEEEGARDPVDLAAAMLASFHARVEQEPLPRVLHIEHPFTVDLHDPETGEVTEEKLTGVIDLVLDEDGRKVIVEHKSSSRKYTVDQIRFDFQPTAYQFAATALGWHEPGLRYQVLTKTKVPALQVEDLRRDDHDEEDFLRLAGGVLRAIDAGAFYPVRGWQCRSCPYKGACSRRSS